LIDPAFKELNGIQEAAITHRHNQINRIEVFLTIKASGQVGFMICGSMKSLTQWASEPEHFAMVSQLKL
jgi:hypothetical protein